MRCVVVAGCSAGACAQEEAAGRAADAAAAARRPTPRAAAAAGAARAGRGAAGRRRPRRSPRTRWRPRSLDDLNRDSPLKPVFFDYDSAELDGRGAGGRSTPTPTMLKKYPTWVDHDRGPLRRARHRRVQPGAGRAPRRRGADLPGVARHPGRPAADRELRQGVPVRSRPQRGGRGRRTGARTSSSPRSSRGAAAPCDGGCRSMPTTRVGAIARACVLLLVARRGPAPAVGRQQGAPADDGRHPDAAGADARSCSAQLATLQRRAEGASARSSTSRRRVTRKAFADQKLLVDTISSDLRVVREKVDDTNVRISSLSQEVEALRLAHAAGRGAMPPAAGGDPAAGAAAPAAARRGAAARRRATRRVAAAAVRHGVGRLRRRAVEPRHLGLRDLHPDVPEVRTGRRRAVLHRRELLPAGDVPRGGRRRTTA